MEERLAKLLAECRTRAHVSQVNLANALHVSRSTLISWEEGATAPSFIKVVEWFDECNEPIYPYIMKFLHPNQFQNLSEKSSDKRINDALHTCIDELPRYKQRELLYILTGSHGSSPLGILDIITAYLHTPLERRINIATSIMTNYEFAEASHKLVKPKYIPPNIALLERCINLGRKAVLERKRGYSQRGDDL